MRAHSAVLDGEIVCLDADRCSRFRDLLFRREWPYFLAFDALAIDGHDLRALPLHERKRRLARIMPRVESGLMLLEPSRAAAAGCVDRWSRGQVRCIGQNRLRTGSVAFRACEPMAACGEIVKFQNESKESGEPHFRASEPHQRGCFRIESLRSVACA